MKRITILTIVIFGLAVLSPVQPPAEAEGLTVNIIHNGMTITVSILALPAHLAHGDTLVGDPCPPNCA